jgi:hypothetical protein
MSWMVMETEYDALTRAFSRCAVEETRWSEAAVSDRTVWDFCP